MRRALCLLLPPAALLAAACAPPAPGGLTILDPSDPARPNFHDMGALRYGARAEHVFHLRNDDPVTVTFTAAVTPCECTQAKALQLVDEDGAVLESGDLERTDGILTVPPGGRVDFVVGVNTNLVRPNQEKLAIMRLVSTSPTTPYLTFEMHLVAERLFSVTPADIRMGEIPMGYGGSAKTTIMTGVPGSPARVLSVLACEGGVEATLDGIHTNGEMVWTLVATFPPDLTEGPHRGRVELATTDAEGEGEEGRLSVDVWAQAVPDVVVLPQNLHFGAVPEGEPGTLRAALRALVPGARVRILDARVEDGPGEGEVTVRWEPGGYVDVDGRSDRWELVLESADDLPPGHFEGRLVIDLDDEQHPRVEAAFQGYVRSSTPQQPR